MLEGNHLSVIIEVGYAVNTTFLGGSLYEYVINAD
jgi:hypothetical protein